MEHPADAEADAAPHRKRAGSPPEAGIDPNPGYQPRRSGAPPPPIHTPPVAIGQNAMNAMSDDDDDDAMLEGP